MNVTLQNTDSLTAQLTVTITPEDYEQKVEQSLKDYRKKVSVKGFRPGKAPASLVDKLYKKSIRVEEVGKILSNGLHSYITENKLDILGEPLSSISQNPIDWDSQSEFEFVFDIAFAPKFELNFSKDDVIPYYSVSISESERTDFIKRLCMRYGSYQPAEISTKDSKLNVFLTELNEDESPKENGIATQETSILIPNIIEEVEKNKLIGAKSGDILVIDLIKALPDENQRFKALGVTKEEVNSLNNLFQLTVNEVLDYSYAEVGQKLFDDVFGEGTISNEDEFNQKIEQEIKNQYNDMVEHKLFRDVRDYFIDKFKVELPKEFMLRWLLSINSNEGKNFSQEQLEKEYPAVEKELKWNIIRDRIIVERNIEVNQEEIMNMAKAYTSRQLYESYGLGGLPDSFIEKQANELLKNKETNRKMIDQVFFSKIMAVIKDSVELESKEIDSEELLKTLRS